jgi:uncharacterized membrane protein YphA (DoxX/SURF4 family)
MKENLALAARLSLGAIFVFAGFQHAVNPPQELAAVMEAYSILPPSCILPLATVLPWWELFLGVFVAAGYHIRLSAAMTGLLLLVFEIALISTIIRGIPLEHCGCFGNAFPLAPMKTMILDPVLLGMAIVSFRYGRERMSVDEWIEHGR